MSELRTELALLMLLTAAALVAVLLRGRSRLVGEESTPLAQLISDLDELITSRGGRGPHYLPDLALKMLATQVLLYGRTFQHLEAGQFVSWSFPNARAAFEAALDLTYLATAPTLAEYDRRGALAHVGAEIAVSKTNGLAREAVPEVSMEGSLSEKERVNLLASEWARLREDATDIVQQAYQDARSAWNKGTRRWTLLSWSDLHEALEEQLGDDKLAKVYRSWYDMLSLRVHPGLHSPQMTRHAAGHDLLIDGDEDNPIPEASIRVALHMACFALTHQYSLWDESDATN